MTQEIAQSNEDTIAAVRRALQQSSFILGAAEAHQFPQDEGAELAFAGRSNVGKSSAINLLTSQGHLARVSKTPGRTQQINFFNVDDSHRIVDLPGYGFAKVPPAMQKKWQALIGAYFESRESLSGVVLLMDARRPLTDLDSLMLDWCEQANVPLLILLNKADKLNRSEQTAALKSVSSAIQHKAVSGWEVQLFSAQRRIGLDQAWISINRLLFSFGDAA